MRASNPIYAIAANRVDAASADDAFAALLDARLQRRSARLWNHLLAWADILNALGWCVALKAAAGPPVLGLNALKALGPHQHSTPDWEAVERHLRAYPPAIHRVNDRDLHVWVPIAPALSAAAPSAPLTPRETAVLHWLREGKTGPEIAIILGCAPRTVESHVARLYRKLGFRNRAQVLLDPGPPS